MAKTLNNHDTQKRHRGRSLPTHTCSLINVCHALTDPTAHLNGFFQGQLKGVCIRRMGHLQPHAWYMYNYTVQ